jgi:hypothetical protein
MRDGVCACVCASVYARTKQGVADKVEHASVVRFFSRKTGTSSVLATRRVKDRREILLVGPPCGRSLCTVDPRVSLSSVSFFGQVSNRPGTDGSVTTTDTSDRKVECVSVSVGCFCFFVHSLMSLNDVGAPRVAALMASSSFADIDALYSVGTPDSNQLSTPPSTT